jgi:hypothetical protein
MTQLSKTINLVILSTLFLKLLIFTLWYHSNKEIIPKQSNQATEWIRYHRLLSSDPSLNAYYSFQDEHLSTGHIRNRKTFFPTAGKDIERPSGPAIGRLVEGQFASKQAIEIDRTAIRIPSCRTDEDIFSITMWIRHNGLGSITGGNITNAATIACLGDGVRNGWRIDLLFPSNRLVFHIARGKTQSTVGVTSSFRIPPKTWTHIGVKRDTECICLYVNGILTGQTLHNAKPTVIGKQQGIQIGYAGNGLSSALLQIAELTIWNTAKSDLHFLMDSLSCRPQKMIDESVYTAATTAFTSGNLSKALELYSKLTSNSKTNEETRSALQLRISEILQLQGKKESAMAIYSAIHQKKNLPLHIRCFALHEFLVASVDGPNQIETRTNSYTLNYTPIYNDLAPATEQYQNAIVEYDFCLPLP